MEEKEDVLAIWQPIGLSTHLISQRVGELKGVKTSHTGTLDPMAEGVIIVLLDESRHEKYELAKWKKTYEFEIAFGISTDTFDGLGLFSEESLDDIDVDEDQINNVLKNLVGDYEQIVPRFSTKKIKGKHLHEHARENTEIDLPKKTGEIFSAKLLELNKINVAKLVYKVTSSIEKVLGDFRQEKILKNWEKFKMANIPKHFLAARIEIEMSKGLYVRSLSQDISTMLGTKGFVSGLVRTKNGEYSKENSQTLEEIFGLDFMDKYDFVSRFKT